MINQNTMFISATVIKITGQHGSYKKTQQLKKNNKKLYGLYVDIMLQSLENIVWIHRIVALLKNRTYFPTSHLLLVKYYQQSIWYSQR